MAEVQEVDALGVEGQIRAWRHRSNTFQATFRDKETGDPINLSQSHAVMVIVDKAGGTQKFIQNNGPSSHVDAANGVSRFYVPASTFNGLTGLRDYTWKYEVYRYPVADPTDKVTHFYGDFRVRAPQAA